MFALTSGACQEDRADRRLQTSLQHGRGPTRLSGHWLRDTSGSRPAGQRLPALIQTGNHMHTLAHSMDEVGSAPARAKAVRRTVPSRSPSGPSGAPGDHPKGPRAAPHRLGVPGGSRQPSLRQIQGRAAQNRRQLWFNRHDRGSTAHTVRHWTLVLGPRLRGPYHRTIDL